MEIKFSDNDLNIEPNDEPSAFDKCLVEKWSEAMNNGYFRYTLDDTQSRVIPGEKRYLLQHNKRRFIDRRPPPPITSLDQPFDPEKFNFTKVEPREIIFSLNNENENGQKKDHPILINVSPLDFCHILLVPQRLECRNQVLREDAISASMRMLLLSNSRHFYVGYNSLLAHATVNHLHVHGWYTKHRLHCSVVDAKPLLREKFLFIFHKNPVNGFVFIFNKVDDIEEVSRSAFQLVSYLHSKEIAHNMTVCRGLIPGEDSHCVRICIWPRMYSTYDDKGANRYNVAVAEISGHIVCREVEDFNNLDEATIISDLNDVSLSNEEFDILKEEIVKCLSSN